MARKHYTKDVCTASVHCSQYFLQQPENGNNPNLQTRSCGICIHTMPDSKKKEIIEFAAMWVELEFELELEFNKCYVK